MNEKENNNSLDENIEKNRVEEVKKEEIESSNRNSRKGEREVVVQYRKPSFFTSLLLILIGVCIATAVLGCVYIFKLKDKKEPVEQGKDTQIQEETPINDTDEEVKIPDVDLDINSEDIKGLYKKVPVDYYINETYSARDNIVTYDSITGIQKLRFVLEEMNHNKEYEEVETTEELLKKYTSRDYFRDDLYTLMGNSHKYDTKVIEEKYKQIFGSNAQIPRQNIETYLGYVYEYIPDEDTYYGHTYVGGGGYGFLYGTKLLRAERSEDGKEIYLYDNYLKAKEDGNQLENRYGIYAYSDFSNEIGRETTVDTNFDAKIREDLFEKYKDSLVTFKHTFKLDHNGNYYWYSTQKITDQM